MGIHSFIRHVLLNTYSVLETVLGIKYIKRHQEVNSIFEERKWKVGWEIGKYTANKKLMHIYKLRKESEAMHVMNSVTTESMWEMAGYHRGESFGVHTWRKSPRNASSKTLRKARPWQIGEVERHPVCQGLGIARKGDGLGLDRRHKSSSFIHSSVHLVHIYLVSTLCQALL